MSASTAVSVEAASTQDMVRQMIEKQMQGPDALREYLNSLPMTQLTDLLAASESSGAFLGVWDGNPQAEDDNDTTICNCSMTAAAFDMSTRRCSCSTTALSSYVDTTVRPTQEQSNSMSPNNNAAAQPVSSAPSPSSHPSDLQEIEPIHLNNENDDDGENIDDFKHTLSSLQHLFEDDPNNDPPPPSCLLIESDTTFLDPLHNFLRTECIEIFVATQSHIDAPGRGSKPSCVGQLGLRCIHCKDMARKELARQAICYPSRRDTIFEAFRNYQRIHLKVCPLIPQVIMDEYNKLSKNASRVSKQVLKVYYAEAASELGIVDCSTHKGLVYDKSRVNTSGVPSQRLQSVIEAAESPSKFASLFTPSSTIDSKLERRKLNMYAARQHRKYSWLHDKSQPCL